MILPSVEYEDVVSEEGILNKDIFKKAVNRSGILFSKNDVLYGKLRPYLHNWLNPSFEGVATGDWWVLKPIGIHKGFLYLLIQSNRFDYVANQSSGSKMPRADWKLVSDTIFSVPACFKEQEELSVLFTRIDHLITLHQYKWVNLIKTKIINK